MVFEFLIEDDIHGDYEEEQFYRLSEYIVKLVGSLWRLDAVYNIPDVYYTRLSTRKTLCMVYCVPEKIVEIISDLTILASFSFMQ